MLSFFYIRSLFDLMIVLAALHEINWFVDNSPTTSYEWTEKVQ